MRKLMAIVLTVLLVMPQAVFGKSISNELEALIIKTKSTIEVPEELTEFTYNISTKDKEDKEQYYNMSWTDKEREIGQVSVLVDSKGHLIQYNKYSYYKEKKQKEVTISQEEGLKLAKLFLDKVMLPEDGEIKEGMYIRPGQGDTYSYVFDQYRDGIKVYQQKVNVEIDKETGEVVRFVRFDPFNGNYEKKGSVISLEEAQSQYLKQLDLSLSYNIKRDYKEKTIQAFPLYQIDKGRGKGISATTGEIIEVYNENDYSPMYNREMKADGAPEAAESKLTSEEEIAVGELGTFLTPEQILKDASRYFPELKDESVKIDKEYLYKDIYNNRYIWRITALKGDETSLKDMNAQQVSLKIASGDTAGLTEEDTYVVNIEADAKTGEVLGYFINRPYTESVQESNAEEAKKSIETFLQAIAPAKYKEVRLKANNTEPKKGERYLTSYYERIANGVPIQGDGFVVTYDSVRKTIVGYDNNWSNVSLKELSTVMPKEEVVKNLGLELMYVSKDKNNKVLAYISPEDYMAFEPYTGQRINAYDGMPYEGLESKIAYEDIAGHKLEAVIKKLYDRGIALEGKFFKPNEKISQVDFMRMLMGMTSSTNTQEEVYERAVRQEILTQEEVNDTKNVTVLEACKYVMRYLGYKDVAELKDIYTLPFEAQGIKAEDKGYVALAYGFGIVDKESVALIKENKVLSRAESAQIIYQMITK